VPDAPNESPSYYLNVLNAIPVAVVVVDSDARIQWFNAAAKRDFGFESGKVIGMASGDAVGCIHSAEAGCGKGSACASCEVRGAVTKGSECRTVTRKRLKAMITSGGTARELELLVTASPLPGVEDRSLLVLEDITELVTLRDIIPICARCKKIRDDQQYWHTVESYFRHHIGVRFSHGLCAACVKVLYPDLSD
jgi:nitrogen fixation/metabolism regulation signal transduction histidine kinase